MGKSVVETMHILTNCPVAALTCPGTAGILLPAWPRLVLAFVRDNTGEPCGLTAIDACRLG